MILVAGMALCGCASRNNGGDAAGQPPVAATGTSATNPNAEPAPAQTQKLIITPASGVAGKVAVYNDAGRFVVLDFPLGHVPPPEQHLFVYRNGLKVGEVSITGPAKDNHTVADIVAGEAQKGDDIRDK